MPPLAGIEEVSDDKGDDDDIPRIADPQGCLNRIVVRLETCTRLNLWVPHTLVASTSTRNNFRKSRF